MMAKSLKKEQQASNHYLMAYTRMRVAGIQSTDNTKRCEDTELGSQSLPVGCNLVPLL